VVIRVIRVHTYVRDLLGHIFLLIGLIVHALVNGDIHLLDKKAISWNSITLLDVDDISNNKVPDRD